MIHTLKRRNFWIMLATDALLVSFSYYLSYILRFDGNIPSRSLGNLLNSIIWVTPVKLGFFFFFGLYKGMWRYTSLYDIVNLLKACVSSSLVVVSILVVSVRFAGFPRSVFIIDLFLCFLLVGGFRLGIRLLFSKRHGNSRFRVLGNRGANLKKILIVGAGDAGEKLFRESIENPNLHHDIVGFIDDDPEKLNHAIHGVPVIGTVEDIGVITRMNSVDEVIIAIPSASAKQMRRIVEACDQVGVFCRTVPGIGELMEGSVSVSAVRNVHYEDLLGRREVDLNLEQINQYLRHKRVLVTGGAGSIGSELCRQIAKFRPQTLVIVDTNESRLHEVTLDLSIKFSSLEVKPVLGPVQNRKLIQNVFQAYKPNIVFHAAAYKHVPMLELNPSEAVFNNILGTQTVLDICAREEVQRCVVVSTDKAVRPTNIMGASKRVCEILTQLYAGEYGKAFMAVRFGNVIGSVGSVVPLFQRQITERGPVTVTHPEVTRYFMTIPEASRLILQTGVIGKGGEIFILKMGVPIRIADMAHDMIMLSGFKPGEDIEIQYIGLRPGEKLYEELITDGEGIVETEHEEIMVLHGNNGVTLKDMNKGIKRLLDMAQRYNGEGIKQELQKLVPEYTPQLEKERPLNTKTDADISRSLEEEERYLRTDERGSSIDRL